MLSASFGCLLLLNKVSIAMRRRQICIQDIGLLLTKRAAFDNIALSFSQLLV
jgi:hypothetical protein